MKNQYKVEESLSNYVWLMFIREFDVRIGMLSC